MVSSMLDISWLQRVSPWWGRSSWPVISVLAQEFCAKDRAYFQSVCLRTSSTLESSATAQNVKTSTFQRRDALMLTELTSDAHSHTFSCRPIQTWFQRMLLTCTSLESSDLRFSSRRGPSTTRTRKTTWKWPISVKTSKVQSKFLFPILSFFESKKCQI